MVKLLKKGGFIVLTPDIFAGKRGGGFKRQPGAEAGSSEKKGQRRPFPLTLDESGLLIPYRLPPGGRRGGK